MYNNKTWGDYKMFQELYSKELVFTQEDSDRLEKILSGFLKNGESVLICYPEKWGNGGEVFSRVVRKCHGIPVVWGGDALWKTLLRQAFFFRCTAAIGNPLVLLGLSKVRNATGTPLYIRNVVLTEDLRMNWLEEGIRRNLDCSVRGFLRNGAAALNEEPLTVLWQELSGWNSVLECFVCREAGGVSLEMVVFPGQRLPRLPSCAKLSVRNWNPEEDHPFVMEKSLKRYAL